MGYTWVNKGSASGVSFTYGNSVYEYDSLNNVLENVDDSKTTRTNDLLFVFRHLDNIEITENNTLKIYINHYRLN